MLHKIKYLPIDFHELCVLITQESLVVCYSDLWGTKSNGLKQKCTEIQFDFLNKILKVFYSQLENNFDSHGTASHFV